MQLEKNHEKVKAWIRQLNQEAELAAMRSLTIIEPLPEATNIWDYCFQSICIKMNSRLKYSRRKQTFQF